MLNSPLHRDREHAEDPTERLQGPMWKYLVPSPSAQLWERTRSLRATLPFSQIRSSLAISIQRLVSSPLWPPNWSSASQHFQVTWGCLWAHQVFSLQPEWARWNQIPHNAVLNHTAVLFCVWGGEIWIFIGIPEPTATHSSAIHPSAPCVAVHYPLITWFIYFEFHDAGGGRGRCTIVQ